MGCRAVRVSGAFAFVLFLVLLVGLAAAASARASSGMIAVQLWSEEVCGTNDCSQDALGVVVVRPDGGGAHRLPYRADEHGEGGATAPRFSPDGRLVAVQVESVGIAVGYPEGSGFRYVYRADAWYESLAWAAWSPRSNALVFAAHRSSDDRSTLVGVSIETGRRWTLESAADPSWSPDGRWIAFTRQMRDTSRVMIIRPDGRGRRTLVVGADPSWSPDGRWIAFTRQVRDTSQVMIIRPDGRGRRTLVHCADDCFVQRWSADGRRVVYYTATVDPDLRSVNVATGKNVPVPEPRYDGSLISPDWRLRATRDDRGVYVARRDGSDRRRILGPPRQWGAAQYELADWQHLP